MAPRLSSGTGAPRRLEASPRPTSTRGAGARAGRELRRADGTLAGRAGGSNALDVLWTLRFCSEQVRGGSGQARRVVFEHAHPRVAVAAEESPDESGFVAVVDDEDVWLFSADETESFLGFHHIVVVGFCDSMRAEQMVVGVGVFPFLAPVRMRLMPPTFDLCSLDGILVWHALRKLRSVRVHHQRVDGGDDACCAGTDDEEFKCPSHRLLLLLLRPTPARAGR